MHHILTALFVLALLLCLAARASAVQPTKAEMNAAKAWIDANLGPTAASHPFSFTYNGRPSAEALKSWATERSAIKLDANRTRHTITFSDPATGLILRCEAVECHDFPTVEWTLYFRNNGKTDTPIIENIQALDFRFQRGDDGEFLLHHAVGSPANGSDYAPLETPLGANATKAADPPTPTGRTSISSGRSAHPRPRPRQRQAPRLDPTRASSWRWAGPASGRPNSRATAARSFTSRRGRS
jgi:alpha-galactosidase